MLNTTLATARVNETCVIPVKVGVPVHLPAIGNPFSVNNASAVVQDGANRA